MSVGGCLVSTPAAAGALVAVDVINVLFHRPRDYVVENIAIWNRSKPGMFPGVRNRLVLARRALENGLLVVFVAACNAP